MAVDNAGPDRPLNVEKLQHGVAYCDHNEGHTTGDICTFMTLHVDGDVLVAESFDVFGTASGLP